MTSVALFGNPNTGKTTLFNRLTDSYAYVGNWSGVTVEKKIGTLKQSELSIVDLPGIYSLDPLTKDERVATDFLLDSHEDIFLNVVNATQLKRNLLLTIELLEYGQPTILIMNMRDSLKKMGIEYDLKILSENLCCDVFATNARNNDGIQEVRHQLVHNQPGITANLFNLTYPNQVEAIIKQFSPILIDNYQFDAHFARWFLIQFINGNQSVLQFTQHHHITELVSIIPSLDTNSLSDEIYQTRLDFIETTLTLANKSVNVKKQISTSKLDKILTHPILGLPMFILIFYLMFKLTFEWIGTPASDYLDELVSGPIRDGTLQILTSLGAMPFLKSLLVDGILAGVGGVLVFIPQIFTLFACISFLEDSGYMARAALVMDKLMSYAGLNGKAFIPLIIGFGCNVPGIMAARTIEQPKERLITTLISPFMSCSARLPIYSLFVGAFFVKDQAIIVLSLYFLGIFIALLMAKIYQKVFKSEENTVFIVELPEYHLPKIRIIAQGTWDKGKGFIKKAGTVIFAGTVLIWALSYFGPAGIASSTETSFSAAIGHGLAPLFIPLGFSAWQAISAMLTGILAKEVIGSTLMVLFASSGHAGLIAALSQYFTPLSAYSFLVFILLYVPCFATIAVIRSETGSWKWALYSVVSSFGIAYICSFIVFQIGSLLGL